MKEEIRVTAAGKHDSWKNAGSLYSGDEAEVDGLDGGFAVEGLPEEGGKSASGSEL